MTGRGRKPARGRAADSDGPRAPRSRRAARLALALALAAGPAAAAELSQLQVTVADGQAKLTFQLDGAFDEAVAARLDSGLPTSFVFQLELHRDRKHWWDDKLREATLEVVAMYNAVTREYLVNFKHDGRLVESRLVRSRDELVAAMSRFEQMPVFPRGEIAPGTRLLVKGRAELGSRTVLAFVPVDVETDWVESRKFRVP
jgi:hypothetical protein